MKIRDVFKEKAAGISFEFFPPKSVEGRQGFMKVVNELKKYDPLYVSVTYGAGGSTQDRTFNTLKWIKEETGLNVMSHLTCIGAARTSMEGLLKDYAENGIDNILALRGDPPKNIPDFDQIKGEFKYAKDLVAFVKGYKSFSIAVAVYPEGHQESPNIEKDIEYTKQKVDAGADFAITQMFFDNSHYYGFVDRALKAGINIPILPGIMPITDLKKVEEFANFCNATMPKEIKKKMETVLDKPEDMRKMGVELAIKQCEDLMRNGVKYLHFYTMNKLETVTEIVEGLGRFHPSL